VRFLEPERRGHGAVTGVHAAAILSRSGTLRTTEHPKRFALNETDDHRTRSIKRRDIGDVRKAEAPKKPSWREEPPFLCEGSKLLKAAKNLVRRFARAKKRRRNVKTCPIRIQLNFDAFANSQKWPSINNERVSASLGARPLFDNGWLFDRMHSKVMTMPVGQHQPGEIHTASTSRLVSVSCPQNLSLKSHGWGFW